MRLIEKSISRNLFESLSSDRVIEAINAAFDGTDFLVNYVESKDDCNVVVGVTAYGQDGEEMSRDIDFEFPNTDFDSVYEVCDEWISSHNSPGLFYENVMISTGSTTITSDETGVVVEDNGNTITVGNGVTVDVDNEADVLPAEMDLVAPEVEAPVEEPTDDAEEELTEAIDKDGGPFPYLMKHGQGPGTLPKDVEIVKYGESSNGKDIVYLNKVLTAEEEAKFEMTPMSNLQDDNINESATYEVDMAIEDNLEDEINELLKSNNADGVQYKVVDTHGVGGGWPTVRFYGEDNKVRDFLRKIGYEDLDTFKKDNINESEQSVDIFKNPEFDYKITDITVLQPTDSGDVRAIDMNDILVGLDEALTERYGNANTVTLNSYLTKHGKDYSSAIVDVSAPNFKGYVYTFESSFDGKLYDCVIKETATNKRLEHLCVKSSDPVKPFVNAIVEAINVSYKLSEHSSISEDVELLVNKDKVEDNNGVTYTDDVRVEEHNDHVEDNMKDKEKKLKPKKRFEVGEEPDQKNTQGEEIAKINLKETEENLVDKLTALKAKLDDNDVDLDTIAGELDIACDEAGYSRLWEEGLILMELVKEHIQKAMAEDFDNGKSMLKHLDDTNAQYAYVDGYANYRNLDKNVLENMIDDIISDLSINESAEETLIEDVNPRAVFHRKPSSVSEMKAAEENGLVTNKSSYVVVNTKDLNSNEFEEFSNNLLREYSWLEELYTTEETDSGVFRCIEVINVDSNESILVDPSGYAYARYAALKTPVETVAEEPIDEVIE